MVLLNLVKSVNSQLRTHPKSVSATKCLGASCFHTVISHVGYATVLISVMNTALQIYSHPWHFLHFFIYIYILWGYNHKLQCSSWDFTFKPTQSCALLWGGKGFMAFKVLIDKTWKPWRTATSVAISCSWKSPHLQKDSTLLSVWMRMFYEGLRGLVVNSCEQTTPLRWKPQPRG